MPLDGARERPLVVPLAVIPALPGEGQEAGDAAGRRRGRPGRVGVDRVVPREVGVGVHHAREHEVAVHVDPFLGRRKRALVAHADDGAVVDTDRALERRIGGDDRSPGEDGVDPCHR